VARLTGNTIDFAPPDEFAEVLNSLPNAPN